ncbi:MAG: chemotaxis protein CheD [Terracidiphilus sp.]|jgi:chemotaxis protein CheD
MPELDLILPDLYLKPGESCLVREPTILRTLLGSCVGIAFRIPRLGVGALCHPMLPTYSLKSAGNSSRAIGCRYVDFAIRDLARQFDALGALRGEVEVKLFGGADVLLVSTAESRPTVGRLNCDAAISVLDSEGFAVLASRLGGTAGVKIQFNTMTGEVLLHELGGSDACSSRHCDPSQFPCCPVRLNMAKKVSCG